MTFYSEKKSFKILKCQNCLLMQVENIPLDLAPFYSEGYFTGDVTLDGYMDYDYDKEVTKKTYLNFLEDIEKFSPPLVNRSIFELGCATGFFLQLAKERKWKVEGIDISEYAVKQVLKKDIKATVGTIENYRSDNKFNVVVMQDVIEHVKDPVNLIIKSRELLADDGLIAITTPDSGSLWARVWGKKWHAFVPPQHLFYFDSNNLSSILRSNGFEVLYLEHHGKWFAIPYIVRLLYSWTGLSIFSRLANLISGTFIKRISIPINLRDTIYLIARKKTL